MDNSFQEKDPSSMVIPSILNSYPSIHLEIRLFYVRFSPCDIDSLPSQLKLRHLHREVGVSLEINGNRIPDLNPASVTLKRDRINKESCEATYLSTDSVRITGSVEFEVLDNEDLVLCGSLERMDDSYWSNGGIGLEKDVRGRWSMECYAANSFGSGWKAGASAPTIEVYIAGRCSESPVILTKTIEVSPRRKNSRHRALDAIPEDEEVEKELRTNNGFLCSSNSQISEAEVEDYETETKYRHDIYSQEMYMGEDGEISWFNAGVRVGVGISLGVCVGVGIGVGLLMRSYQATTRNFRRRFF